jgi:hypothetical protein
LQQEIGKKDIMEIVEKILEIAKDKNIKAAISVSGVHNPSKGITNIKYWLDIPELGVVGYFEEKEINKYIEIWSKSAETNVKKFHQENGEKLAV